MRKTKRDARSLLPASVPMPTIAQDIASCRKAAYNFLVKLNDAADVNELLDKIAYDPSEWGEDDCSAIARNWLPSKRFADDRPRLAATLWHYRQGLMKQMKREFWSKML